MEMFHRPTKFTLREGSICVSSEKLEIRLDQVCGSTTQPFIPVNGQAGLDQTANKLLEMKGQRGTQRLKSEHTCTHTHTQTYTNIQFSPDLFSLLSPQQAVVSLYCYQCCYRCRFLIFFFNYYYFISIFVCLFSSSKSNKEKWTLDGLLKLCNVKAKQMCFCYLCLQLLARVYRGGHFQSFCILVCFTAQFIMPEEDKGSVWSW